MPDINNREEWETFLMLLNIDNDIVFFDETRKIVEENKEKEIWEIAEKLKDCIDRLSYDEKNGIYRISDIWTQRDFDAINWNEIAKEILQELKENESGN